MTTNVDVLVSVKNDERYSILDNFQHKTGELQVVFSNLLERLGKNEANHAGSDNNNWNLRHPPCLLMNLVVRYPFCAIRKLNRTSASSLEVTRVSYFAREIDIPKQEGAGQPGLWGAVY
jgi:hypothetical protein